MVITCCAVGCNERNKPGKEKIRFFRFPRGPKNKERHQLWVKATNRAGWTPTKSSVLCQKHFQTGQPSLNSQHPDYVPNVFPHTKADAKSHLHNQQTHRKTKLVPRNVDDTMHTVVIRDTETTKTSKSKINQRKSKVVIKNDGKAKKNLIIREVIPPELLILDQKDFQIKTEDFNLNLDPLSSEIPILISNDEIKTEEQTPMDVTTENLIWTIKTEKDPLEEIKTEKDPLEEIENVQLDEINQSDGKDLSEEMDQSDEVEVLEEASFVSNVKSELTRGDILVAFQKLVKENNEINTSNYKLNMKNEELTEAIKKLETELEMSKKQQSKHDVLSEYFLDSQEVCRYYTPFLNKAGFMSILEQFKKMYSTKKIVLSPESVLLVVCMDMKLKLKKQDLALRFRVDTYVINYITKKWTPIVKQLLDSRLQKTLDKI